jgi:hypothetical protein
MSLGKKDTSEARRKTQRGIEAMEFSLFFMVVFLPLLMMFISGMNFLRFIKSTDAARSTALLYVKGQDLTSLGTQRLLSTVASGLDLEVGSTAGAGGNTAGSGLIVVSIVEYVGTTSCSSCTNVGHYVFQDRFFIGNTTLQVGGTTATSVVGNVNTSAQWSSTTGAVTGYLTDAHAQIPNSLTGLFPTGVTDSQTIYIVECFFSDQTSKGFAPGQFTAPDIYSRVVM